MAARRKRSQRKRAPQKPATGSADADSPDPERVTRNRLRFINWVTSTRGSTDLGFDFDLPGEKARHIGRLPFWWPLRPASTMTYCERVREQKWGRGRLGNPTMDLVTVYLLALELGEGEERASAAREQLRQFQDAEHLEPTLRQIAGEVRGGQLAPHPTWLGDLEWRILEEVGVTWPNYVIERADLGPGHYEEFERDVGERLISALAKYVPSKPAGSAQDGRTAILHAYGLCDLRPVDLRRMLFTGAAEAAADYAVTRELRTDAALGALGLWTLLLGQLDLFPRDSDVQALRSLVDVDIPPVCATFAKQLARTRRRASMDDLQKEYWRAVDVVDVVEAPPTTATEAPRTRPESDTDTTDPLLDLDDSAEFVVDGIPTGIALATGPGALLAKILKHEPKVLKRRPDRTELAKALRAASGGRVRVARARPHDVRRQLTCPVRIGRRLKARLKTGDRYVPGDSS